MSVAKVYEEMVDFIATGPSRRKVAAFRPSAQTRRRVADLIEREKTVGLSPDEASELEHYMHLEHVMRLAKARARKRQTHE